MTRTGWSVGVVDRSPETARFSSLGIETIRPAALEAAVRLERLALLDAPVVECACTAFAG
jgi:hypothetical protein